MSKKNSNVSLKDSFKNYNELTKVYSIFSQKIRSINKKTFLVAVSGGPDSLALTALAKFYSYENRCKIYYVLIDHKIRKNSSKEAKSVKKLLKKHNINLNIINNKKKIKKNLQSEARLIRYNLIINFCKKKKIKTIITAHNLEDQVETFFIRLSRGSGLHGLSSMKEINKIDNNISLIRPLLDLKKDQLIKISKKIFGKYYKDPSNRNTKYLRTKIRNFRSQLESSGINYDQISKSIKNLASSRDTLDFYFNKIYKEMVHKRKNMITIKLNNLKKLNDEMKMRVFKKAIKDFSNSYYSVRAKKIFNLIEHLKRKKTMKLTLGGCLVLGDKKHIIIKKENKRERFF